MDWALDLGSRETQRLLVAGLLHHHQAMASRLAVFDDESTPSVCSTRGEHSRSRSSQSPSQPIGSPGHRRLEARKIGAVRTSLRRPTTAAAATPDLAVPNGRVGRTVMGTDRAASPSRCPSTKRLQQRPSGCSVWTGFRPPVGLAVEPASRGLTALKPLATTVFASNNRRTFPRRCRAAVHASPGHHRRRPTTVGRSTNPSRSVVRSSCQPETLSRIQEAATARMQRGGDLVRLKPFEEPDRGPLQARGVAAGATTKCASSASPRRTTKN